jgi:hypothetical protein
MTRPWRGMDSKFEFRARWAAVFEGFGRVKADRQSRGSAAEIIRVVMGPANR